MKKTVTLLSVVGLLLLALPVWGQQSQTRPHAHVKGQGKRLGPQRDADHQALAATARQIALAQKQMKAALPIYEGHRHRAMEVDKVMMRVLRAAIRWTPNAPTQPINVQQLLSQIGQGNEGGAKPYSSAEVSASDQRMRQALGCLQAAKSELGRVTGSYGGNVAEAAQLLDVAIDEVNKALQVRH